MGNQPKRRRYVRGFELTNLLSCTSSLQSCISVECFVFVLPLDRIQLLQMRSDFVCVAGYLFGWKVTDQVREWFLSLHASFSIG
jgi:hypothetical protein